jgi:hypothetical protein
MEYIAQRDELGCFIAAAAMVLDLTYEQVALTVPLQEASIIEQTGINFLGLLALDRIEALALAQGKQIVDLNPPFPVRAGLRYLAMIPTEIYQVNHALAVDETGIAFNPDPRYEHVRSLWSEYFVLGLLEFRPL